MAVVNSPNIHYLIGSHEDPVQFSVRPYFLEGRPRGFAQLWPSGDCQMAGASSKNLFCASASAEAHMKLFLDEEPGKLLPFVAYTYIEGVGLKFVERFSTMQEGYEFCEEYAAAHAHVGARRVGEWDL